MVKKMMTIAEPPGPPDDEDVTKVILTDDIRPFEDQNCMSIDLNQDGYVDFNCDTYHGFFVYKFTPEQLRLLADWQEEAWK